MEDFLREPSLRDTDSDLGQQKRDIFHHNRRGETVDSEYTVKWNRKSEISHEKISWNTPDEIFDLNTII